MATTDVFRGLAQTNLDAYAPPDPDDPYVAAFPTFRSFTPAGGTARDELILFRSSVATTQALRLIADDTLSHVLSFWAEDDVPRVFRALNPLPPPIRRGFPTFTYGRNSSGRFMNVVLLKSGFLTLTVAPDTPGFSNPDDVEAMCRAAQTWAQTNGRLAAFPLFSRSPLPGAPVPTPADQLGHVLLVVPSGLAGVVVNSRLAPGLPLAPRWTFRSLPVLLGGPVTGYGGIEETTLPDLVFAGDDIPKEEGLAIIENMGSPELYFRSDGNLVQFRPDATTQISLSVDPDTAGTRRQDPAEGSVSAASTMLMTHVLWGGPALFHAQRQANAAGGFAYEIASGRTSPEPTGDIGHFNRAVVGPDGTLHVLAYLHRQVGVGLVAGTDEMTTGGQTILDETRRRNLAHLSFDGTTWSQEVVDGDSTNRGQIIGDCGVDAAAAFEPNGTLHAFYLFRDTTGPSETYQLRHAELSVAGWSAETLDGAGAMGGTYPPGAGPTTAHVGFSPAAAFFDGALWVAYEDRTYGNVRCARGRRRGAAPLLWDWEYHVVDGSSGGGRTKDTVRTIVAQVWDDKLSLIYADVTRSLVRHAMREANAKHWKYEVVDGAGGLDGRLATKVLGPIAIAPTIQADGTPSLRLFVVYRSEGVVWSELRLATLNRQTT